MCACFGYACPTRPAPSLSTAAAAVAAAVAAPARTTGYKIINVARCWALETGLAVGADLAEQLPPNEYYDYYGPGGWVAGWVGSWGMGGEVSDVMSTRARTLLRFTSAVGSQASSRAGVLSALFDPARAGCAAAPCMLRSRPHPQSAAPQRL